MRLKDNYFELKEKYKNYIIMMKSGTFYNVLGNDCYVFKNIFNYKINRFSDTVKVAFPLNTLNKVVDTFDRLKINYIVYEGEIKLKGKFHGNNYDCFIKDRLTINERIERINILLNEAKHHSNIIKILDAIEEII